MSKNKEVLIGPTQIAFDITNKCNLRCLHCYNESGENIQSQSELSDEEILSFIDDLCKIKIYNFCFCGGEPLLRKELVIEASKRLMSAGVPNIALVTNGLLMTKEIALQFKDAGIERIQISLDGSNCKSHDRLRNKKGSFDAAINAIKSLISVGIKPNIAFTPTSFNIGEIEEVHNLLRQYELFDIDFRTQPLMLLGRANNNLIEIQPTELDYRKFVRKITEINENKIKPYIKWGDPVDHLIRFREKDLCINQVMIRANGDIVCSAYLPLVVGNLKKYSLIDYWNAGLGNVWNYKIPMELSKNIKSINDMSKKSSLPILWKEEDLFIDLIDSNLNDLSLIELENN